MISRPAALALALVLALAFCVIAEPAAAERERIRDYSSEITVHADASLTIVETIKVVASGNKIKRGIYRDFPTDYTDSRGNRVRVGFSVIEVLRDGEPEPYFTERRGNGVRVYIGRKDVILAPDHYSYSLTFRTDRQLGFFDDFDELYFNAIGTGWVFPIERARAVVHLPPGAQALNTTAFTGRSGSTGRDFSIGVGPGGAVTIKATRQLNPGEGLTFAVSWPKGFVAAPTAAESAGYLLRDNSGILAGLIGLLVVGFYYWFAWKKVGRDPESGPIIPLFAPPEGFSPAAARFVLGMSFDKKVFTAAIVNMAVKGYINIEDDDGDYLLKRRHRDRSALSPGESKLAKTLFGSSSELLLDNDNHEIIQKAIKGLKAYLRDEFEKLHFMRNRGYFIPGIAVSLLTLFVMVFSTRLPPLAATLTMGMAVGVVGCGLILVKILDFRARGQQLSAVLWSVLMTLIIVAELAAMLIFTLSGSLFDGVLVMAILVVNVLFYFLLKAPTLKGRAIMDRIEGFRLYLRVAEKDRLEASHPPDMTPEVFEKYLPFALALDVENEWSENFASAMAAAGAEQNYRPRWYAGHGWRRHGISGIGSNLGGAFSNAISSASTPPGSSSGGGGFSGGGGGGGGGGGW